MADLTRIDASAAVEITDGVSQSCTIATATPLSSATGLVVREAARGQQTMAASIPVVLASDQSSISVTVSGTTTVTGTVTANAGTGTFTVADNQTIVDNAAFTDGTSKVFMGGYVFDETAGTALTENDAAAARVDSKRAQVFVIEDATTRGQRATVTAANAVKVDGSAVTQPVSGTVTANAGTGNFSTNIAQIAGSTVSTAATGIMKVGVTDSAGTSITVGQKTMANSFPVVISSDQSAVTVQGLQGSATTGNITANGQTVSLAVSNYASVTFSINGTYAGINLAFEVSDDGGTTWYSDQGMRSDGSAIETTSGALTNTSRQWVTTLGGETNFRVRATSYTSGTANIRIIPFAVATPSYVTTAMLGNVTVVQPTASSLNAQVVGNIPNNSADSGNPLKIGGKASSAIPTAVTAGNRVDAWFDLNGRLVVALGTKLDSTNDSVTCVGDVAHDAVDSGNPQKIGGYASSTTPTAVASGDRVNGYFDTNGRLVVRVDAGPTGGGSIGTVTCVGDLAHDAVDSGNPVKIGAVARTTNQTAVANGDRTNLSADKLGKLINTPFASRELVVTGTITLTTTTETTIIAAGGAGVFHDVVHMVITNSSNTQTSVLIRDATGGTVRMTADIGTTVAGGGSNPILVVPFTTPWPQTTANNNWTAQLSTAATSIHIFLMAVKNV